MEALAVIKPKTEFELRHDQEEALNRLFQFTENDNESDSFILSGSAGTGKTSLIKEYIRQLERQKIDYVLLAPTGQAAKVLAKKTGSRTKTLHSFVYVLQEEEVNETIRYRFIPRQVEVNKRLVIIVDEASMVNTIAASNEVFVSKNSVLDDLVKYYKECPNGSKIIFVGDPYQLPPVGEYESVALNADKLSEKYRLSVIGYNLTEILRHGKESYILRNASILRKLIESKQQYSPPLKYKEMYRSDLAIGHYCSHFDHEKIGQVVFLGWKNLTVFKLNLAIRSRLLNEPSAILCEKEQIIVGQSYFGKKYLAAGEIGKILSFDISSKEQIAGKTFAEAEFQFTMANGEVVSFKSKFDMDYLLNNKLENEHEIRKNLWADRKKHNKLFRETENISDDPYLSAIKIKYGYAITTHKAQGSEWDHVFLYPEFPLDENRLKWIYTAITRAKYELYSFSEA